ncbi:MAG TPA: C25 family cysteine peptidase, partial [Thermoanaerobaculia bacterium]|nr:C25 family cysteine peptidase [Thermoanaerobaculia bacterium]
TFSFFWGRVNTVNGDQIAVQVSANGGTTYTTLETLTNTSTVGSRSYNITSSIAANTRIRFMVTGGLNSNTHYFFFNDVQIADAGGPLTAGHWQVQVDESSAVTAGADINAFGLRADDGDATSGGTEIPIYIDSQNQFGVDPPATGTSTRSYTAYPYITSGCTAVENDFDYDSDQPSNVGSIVFSSRTGVSTQTIASAALSNNNVWKQNTINSWTTDSQATEYGIWSMVLTINSYNDGGPNGNYTTFYAGNSSSAAPPPGANPVTNAFRLYLPTDAGTAPVKPYVEQFVRYLVGPNPPAVNQTQTDTVTVRVVNPTAKAITFSNTNLVTANIPGGAALYAGNPQKSQGTVVSAPAVGGSGNITWNPGTLAAGATAILAYNVNVKPTTTGQRVTVVGTVASGNGTKAVWLDETGNSSQARATFTFGPLCELAVTQGMLTEAVISGFSAYPADGGLALEWKTASEAGTIGFDLYRRDRRAADGGWTKVNRDLLLGLLTAPQGGTYRFVDPAAAPEGNAEYLLVEIDAQGRRRSHGPFAVRPDWSRAAAGDAPYMRTARAPEPQKARTVLAPRAASGPVEALHVLVRESGLYYLSSGDLAPWFAVPQATMEKLLGDGRVSLTHAGQPVAWYPDLDGKRGKGLFFYGEASHSLFSKDTVYRLARGNGLLMETAPAAPATGSGPAAFTAVLHAEEDLLPATALPLDPSSDYWFWDFILGGDPTYGSKSFSLDAPGRTATGTAALTVHLEGASSSDVPLEHHVAVALNGTALGEDRFQGIAAHDSTFTFNPSLLTAAGNQVQVTGLLDAGTPYSIFYVNSFDLSYPRTFKPAGDALAFTAAAGPLAVGGFSSPNVRLLDLIHPTAPRLLTGAAVAADPQGGWDLRWNAPAPAPYLAVAPGGTKTPVLTPFRNARLRDPGNHADLLVLAGTGLHEAAQRLADYRSGQGLDSQVVDIDEVTDEFAYGLPDPHAVPSFLAYARSSWQKAPRYLVLAGAGTVDYRDLLGYGGNLLPPLFVVSDGGIYPSDATLADGNGDGLPDLAVGRIPAHSAAELNSYIDKLIAYETGADGGWTGSAVALADAPDQGADFATGSDRIASFLPGTYNLDRIDLGTTTLSDARSRLLRDLQAGTSLVIYVGHGGLDRLSAGGLLDNADVPGLGNAPRLPVISAMTCSINRFAVPGVASLGELLVNQGDGGAAAVWAPAGLSVHSEAQLLAERYYRHLGDPDAARLGDIVQRALADFKSLGGDPAMIEIYDLLGDPALLLRRP